MSNPYDATEVIDGALCLLFLALFIVALVGLFHGFAPEIEAFARGMR